MESVWSRTPQPLGGWLQKKVRCLEAEARDAEATANGLRRSLQKEAEGHRHLAKMVQQLSAELEARDRTARLMEAKIGRLQSVAPYYKGRVHELRSSLGEWRLYFEQEGCSFRTVDELLIELEAFCRVTY